MIKVCFFDTKPYDKLYFDKALQGTDIQLVYVEPKLNARTAPIARGYDAVIVFVNDQLDKDCIEALHEGGVKLIALRCAGYNNVDFKSAFGKIHVVRVPAYSPYAVAEHTMALLLSLNRKIHRAYNRVREFNFSLNGLTGFDIHGKTIGVIGTGKIGRVFIDICKGFGADVIAYDPYPAKDSGIDYRPLDELFKLSDIISLHCPLTQDTYHMINGNSIKKMKDGVIILNTSRGALIHTEALLEGLMSEKIGGAGLDVYEEESDLFYEDMSNTIIKDDQLVKLISLPNVVLTSHQAFLTREALQNIAETTVKNITDFFHHNKLENEICYMCHKSEKCTDRGKNKCF